MVGLRVAVLLFCRFGGVLRPWGPGGLVVRPTGWELGRVLSCAPGGVYIARRR
jgi:hypothetical protein